MRPGDTVAGKFRIERELGKGGMGTVLVVTHLQLEQRVALKVLHDGVVQDGLVAERLLREARASATLRSEHACRVMDAGVTETGRPYIAMELLEGEDLAALLRRAPLTPELAAEYVLQACVAVAEAHAAGIVHRDLKPSNLFVTRRLDDTALIKVLDFGIAKTPSKSSAALTTTTTVIGSPAYMSPEQVRSAKAVDARSDIWSLGVILYEAVAGRVPFLAETITELAVKIVMDEHVPPATDPALAAVIDRCLAKEPEARFPSIDALATALAPIAGERGRASVETIARIRTKARRLADAHAATVDGGLAETVAGGEPAPDGRSTTLTNAAAETRPAPHGSSRGRWLALAALVLAATTVGAGAIALRGCAAESDRDPAAGSVAVRPPVDASAARRSAPVDDERRTKLKAALFDLARGRTCADRRAVIPRIVALGDPAAIPALRAARYRMRGGVLGVGQDNTNACLRADAEAAIRELSGEAPAGDESAGSARP